MTKVISLSNKAYSTLSTLKESEESFSDVVLRISQNATKKPITYFYGRWPGPTDELDAIEKQLAKDRKSAKTRDVMF